MSSTIICAIDPGKKPGFCVVEATKGDKPALIYAGKEPAAFRDYVSYFHRHGAQIAAILETPVVYQGGKSDPNAIVQLALTAGALARFAFPAGIPVACVEPTTWKGAIKKAMHHQRIRPGIVAGLFRNTDYAIRVWDQSNTDEKDAIALAIWRMDPTKFHPMLTFSLDNLDESRDVSGNRRPHYEHR